MADLIDTFGARAGFAVAALRDANWQLTVLEKGVMPTFGPKSEVPEVILTEIARHLGIVQKFCEDVDLQSPLDELARIRAAFKKPPVTVEDLGAALFDVTKRLQDELLRRKFYYLDARHHKYFKEAHEILSLKALAVFGVASRDAEESGKCFALGRYTACVFHLMRVMEHGMNALAVELGVLKEYQTWDKKIAKMVEVLTGQLRQTYTSGSLLAGRMEFFKQATERLTAVQHALRNETMHARSHYGEDDAEETYRSVMRFMENLAEHLTPPAGDQAP